MAEDKKGFLLYADLIHTIEKMPNDKAGLLFKHILKYVNDLNPVTDDLIVELTFEPIKQQLKRDLLKYKETKIDKSNGGKLGNLKRWHKDLHDKVVKNELDINEAIEIANNRKTSHTDTMQSLPIGQIAVNVNDNVNVNVNDNVINKFNFRSALISFGFNSELVSEWLKVRKAKHGVNTETAFNRFISEVEKNGNDKNYILQKCVENSWKGFESDWIKKETISQNKQGVIIETEEQMLKRRFAKS